MFPLRETPLFFCRRMVLLQAVAERALEPFRLTGKRCCFETVSFRENCRKNGMEGADACGDLLRFK